MEEEGREKDTVLISQIFPPLSVPPPMKIYKSRRPLGPIYAFLGRDVFGTYIGRVTMAGLLFGHRPGDSLYPSPLFRALSAI